MMRDERNAAAPVGAKRPFASVGSAAQSAQPAAQKRQQQQQRQSGPAAAAVRQTGGPKERVPGPSGPAPFSPVLRMAAAAGGAAMGAEGGVGAGPASRPTTNTANAGRPGVVALAAACSGGQATATAAATGARAAGTGIGPAGLGPGPGPSPGAPRATPAVAMRPPWEGTAGRRPRISGLGGALAAQLGTANGVASAGREGSGAGGSGGGVAPGQGGWVARLRSLSEAIAGSRKRAGELKEHLREPPAGGGGGGGGASRPDERAAGQRGGSAGGGCGERDPHGGGGGEPTGRGEGSGGGGRKFAGGGSGGSGPAGAPDARPAVKVEAGAASAATRAGEPVAASAGSKGLPTERPVRGAGSNCATAMAPGATLGVVAGRPLSDTANGSPAAATAAGKAWSGAPDGLGAAGVGTAPERLGSAAAAAALLHSGEGACGGAQGPSSAQEAKGIVAGTAVGGVRDGGGGDSEGVEEWQGALRRLARGLESATQRAQRLHLSLQLQPQAVPGEGGESG